MAVSLKSLYQESKKKFSLELLAGKEGFEKTVSWVHLIEDTSTTDFIRGSELIITTGLGMNDDYWLDRFIENLVLEHAVGLIVNIGTYIKEISEHTLQLCNQLGFPLFVMPWKIHIVDIMQDFCNRIILAEQTDRNKSTIFFNALFTPEKNDSYESALTQNGYEVSGSYSVLVIHPNSQGEIQLQSQEALYRKIKITISNLLNHYSIKYHVLANNEELILIFHNIKKEDIEKYVHKLFEEFQMKYADNHLRFGVGPIIKGAANLHNSYKKGCSVLHIKKRKKENLIFYDEIGIYKVILAVEDHQVLVKMYKEALTVLEEYDKKHGTDFMEILRLYILYNSSVQAVADHTFTHRNTINYRIKKIKELLGSDLNDMEERFRFQLAFYIKDTLEDV